MRELLFNLVQNPSAETYLALREALMASVHYQPYSDEFDTVGELVEQEKLAEARDVLAGAMANLILSPRAHHIAAYLNFKLGDEKAAQFESMLADACLEGMAQSGDGSKCRPYLVSRTSDEYDLIQHLGQELKQQSLISDADQHFDLLACADGTDIWFDITPIYNHLKKELG